MSDYEMLRQIRIEQWVRWYLLTLVRRVKADREKSDKF